MAFSELHYCCLHICHKQGFGDMAQSRSYSHLTGIKSKKYHLNVFQNFIDKMLDGHLGFRFLKIQVS